MKLRTQQVMLVALAALVSCVSADTHYVDINCAMSTPPYTNWVTATTVIQDAVDVAEDGDTVLVADGVYTEGGMAVYGTMTNRVAINKPITVRSVNGPSVTTILGRGPMGNGAVRCAYVTNSAVLSGFTLTNGATHTSGDYTKERSGGGVWCESSGVVSSCTLSGNSAYSSGGGAYGGTLNNCTLTGNSAGGVGGGACGGTLSQSKLVGNTANHGGGVKGGVLNNCTLMRNSAVYYGGGAYESTLHNCTLMGNSATTGGGGAYTCTLKNCIVYYNSRHNYLGSTIDYCCTTPLPSPFGTGNITNEPLFINSTNENLHLLPNSPCINAGLNEDWMFTSVDLDGSPRIRNGAVDMGAYEFAFKADLSGLLKGPYNTNTHVMISAVGTNLPVTSPYAADATELDSSPTNVVDWVLVEVQDTNWNTVASSSVLLDEQGSICDSDGAANIPVEVSSGSYYLVLRHRNHLSVISAQPVAFTNTVVSYDFTTGSDKYFGGTNACVELEPGVWGLISGDVDGDGRITPVARIIVERQKGMTGYLQGDLNMDGKVDGDD